MNSTLRLWGLFRMWWQRSWSFFVFLFFSNLITANVSELSVLSTLFCFLSHKINMRRRFLTKFTRNDLIQKSTLKEIPNDILTITLRCFRVNKMTFEVFPTWNPQRRKFCTEVFFILMSVKDIFCWLKIFEEI